jgi:hypothetical protein
VKPPRSTRQYQFTTATSTSPEAVLDGISALALPDDLCVNERGSTYLVLGPKPSFYDARLAVALATLVVLAVLILTAFWVVLVALLPLGVLPLLPLLIRDNPLLAVGAVPEDDGCTRVTVHGQAPLELTGALDLFLSRLPRMEPPAPTGTPNGNGNGTAGAHRNGHGAAPDLADTTVRAPEPSGAEQP